uniref:Response regulatory domain-containing protein n=1 Tax=Chrysotila carterae TaxID=13221 RepID=A0A7S4F409_CHRCT
MEPQMMEPATAGENQQSRNGPCRESAALGRMHSPTAASQFPMSPWTLRFKDESVETAHQETRANSPTLLCVLTICNAVFLGAYCTGIFMNCETIRANFTPLIVLNVLYQATELCFYLRFPIAGQACYGEGSDARKLFYVTVAFVGLTLWADAFPNGDEADFEDSASIAFCSHIGLLYNGNAAICIVLLPYVTHSTFTLKICISGMIASVHAISPFWLPVGIELPAICISLSIGNALGYVLEHSLRSTFREQHARLADQELLMQMKVAANMRLTHTIKGKCGTANSLAFAVISCLQGICIEQVQRALQLVHRMRFLLEEAEWWCNHRQLCVHLELGTYQTKRTACDVKARIKQLVGCNGDVDKCAFTSCSVDATVLGLAMDEAFNNAQKFRERGTKIAISMQVEEDDGQSMLHVQMDSTNRANVPLLTTEQCLRVVQCGYKKHDLSAFSDGVGLANVQQAAHAVGGRIWLNGYSTSLRENHTVFHLLIPVDGVVWRGFGDESATEDENSEALEELPVFWNDEQEDSGTRRGGAYDADQTHDPSAFNASETSNAEAISRLACPADSRSVDDFFVCLGLDDSSVCRQLHELLFSDFLEADMSRSASLGATVEEVESFVDVALGLKTTDLTHVPEGECRPVDVVLIDQHLIVEDRRCLGSEIAQTLRARGFGGVICLMSGTVTEHLHELQQQAVIDVAFSKGASPVDIADTIHQLHDENVLKAQRNAWVS